MTDISLPIKDEEHERVLGIVFDISPAQASVLSCLCRGTIATTAQLIGYTGTKPPIKPVVSRTRKKLRDHKISIHSKANVGYWLEPEDRLRVENMVKNFLGE